MKRIVLASNNVGKIRELRTMLDEFDIVSPQDIGIDFSVEETGSTFYDNALIKARALYLLCGLPAVADDSGLCVDALGGAPGVYSARYSGGGDKANNKKLLAELDGVRNRAAHFSSCIVYYDGINTVAGHGDTYGTIGYSEEGCGGFGYDPLFISDDLKKSFGVASAEEKNAVSHRYRAIKDLKAKLADIKD